MLNKQNVVICPDCENQVEKPKVVNVGDILECKECGTEIEILSLDPFKYVELVEEK